MVYEKLKMVNEICKKLLTRYVKYTRFHPLNVLIKFSIVFCLFEGYQTSFKNIFAIHYINKEGSCDILTAHQLSRHQAVTVLFLHETVSFRELEEGNTFLEDMIKSTQATLQSSLTDLDVDEGLKERLLDITSNEVMEGTQQNCMCQRFFVVGISHVTFSTYLSGQRFPSLPSPSFNPEPHCIDCVVQSLTQSTSSQWGGRGVVGHRLQYVIQGRVEGVQEASRNLITIIKNIN